VLPRLVISVPIEAKRPFIPSVGRSLILFQASLALSIPARNPVISRPSLPTISPAYAAMMSQFYLAGCGFGFTVAAAAGFAGAGAAAFSSDAFAASTAFAASASAAALAFAFS